MNRIWVYRKPSAYASPQSIRHRRHLKRRIHVAACPYCDGGGK